MRALNARGGMSCCSRLLAAATHHIEGLSIGSRNNLAFELGSHPQDISLSICKYSSGPKHLLLVFLIIITQFRGFHE